MNLTAYEKQPFGTLTLHQISDLAGCTHRQAAQFVARTRTGKTGNPFPAPVAKLARTGAYLYQAAEGADWARREQIRRKRLNMTRGQGRWSRNG